MKKIIFSVILSVCTLLNAIAQEIPKTSEEEKTEVVTNLCKLVKDEYVNAETGSLASKKLEENLKAGKYKDIKDVMEFSEVLTNDLQEITKDKHFIVDFAPDQVQQLKIIPTKQDSLDLLKNQIEEGKAYNFGFDELKILDGNIGYLDLKGFFPLDITKEAMASAMNFLSNADALIIDLRSNHGGSLDMPPYFASYFLGAEKQTLLQFLGRNNKEEDKTETTTDLEGKRWSGKPLYILTSRETFSAAEAFSYTLKNRKAAVFVGERSGGGANPVEPKIINSNFVLGLPTYKPVDPLTNTNWEGTGVVPDIEVSADKAKETAHIKALEAIADQSKNPEIKWLVEILKGRYNPVTLNEKILKSYAGKYGIRSLFYENNTLMYQKEGNSKTKLIAINPTTFVFEDNTDLKIEMIIENNKVTGFKRIFSNGDIRVEKRD